MRTRLHISMMFTEVMMTKKSELNRANERSVYILGMFLKPY